MVLDQNLLNEEGHYIALEISQGQLVDIDTFRPEVAAAEDIARFGELNLVTIEDFGGWREAQPKYFGDGGVFDQIYSGPAQ